LLAGAPQSAPHCFGMPKTACCSCIWCMSSLRRHTKRARFGLYACWWTHPHPLATGQTVVRPVALPRARTAASTVHADSVAHLVISSSEHVVCDSIRHRIPRMAIAETRWVRQPCSPWEEAGGHGTWWCGWRRWGDTPRWRTPWWAPRWLAARRAPWRSRCDPACGMRRWDRGHRLRRVWWRRHWSHSDAHKAVYGDQHVLGLRESVRVAVTLRVYLKCGYRRPFCSSLAACRGSQS